MKKPKIKTIDIQAKEWFDKVNGNSYFAGLITVNFGMKTERKIVMPFQYGYDRAYEDNAKTILKNMGIIDTTYHQELRESGIIVRSHIVTGCKKSELKAY